jgi:hypothetical protein
MTLLQSGSFEEKWEGIKKGILKAAKDKIGIKKLENRKPWITQEVLDLIEGLTHGLSSRNDARSCPSM